MAEFTKAMLVRPANKAVDDNDDSVVLRSVDVRVVVSDIVSTSSSDMAAVAFQLLMRGYSQRASFFSAITNVQVLDSQHQGLLEEVCCRILRFTPPEQSGW
jgi:hypothetical protein